MFNLLSSNVNYFIVEITNLLSSNVNYFIVEITNKMLLTNRPRFKVL